ncbi:AbrB/MazE/SpoVT family DNA-binding domain-containing protein [Haloarchaeobius sp. HME9146]|uniref:AbrB/MazE/SpoVT family DNA-binding domain-containing protein n=1 Tax=Haloarchaeobius sp. HME9146 TaxID=2978732 RepID=UPI0021BF4AE2|nr:AbrB/MazE/SpoVT family DNA-binding domain-containing protein [Haloarchaeobius sp. HME9146]MCT9094677.1 AbrB/MazE/SpoVT family DNA-binding domain-containing protein [Haloarchaeobius sp. HME9146]
METRKLQTVGGGTYTVSIPKDWARENSLESGTEVYLFTHTDGSIIVRSTKRDTDDLADASIGIDGTDPALVTRALRAAHAIGFETVTLTPGESFTDEQRRTARSLVGDLVGTEVLVESAEEITVQNLLSAADVSVRQSVVQLQFVVLSINRTATTAFTDGREDVHDQLRDRADDAERLAGMVARHFNRSLVSLGEVDRLGISRPELFDYYDTARQLESVAAMAVDLARVSEHLTEPLPETVAADVHDVADATRQVVDDAATAVLKGGPDVEMAHEVLDRHDDTLADIAAMEQAVFEADTDDIDLTATEKCALVRGLDSLARTAECGGAIADVAVRASTRADHL